MDYSDLAMKIKEINEQAIRQFKQGIDISPYAANHRLVEYIIELNRDNKDFNAAKFRELAGYEKEEYNK